MHCNEERRLMTMLKIKLGSGDGDIHTSVRTNINFGPNWISNIIRLSQIVQINNCKIYSNNNEIVQNIQIFK